MIRLSHLMILLALSLPARGQVSEAPAAAVPGQNSAIVAASSAEVPKDASPQHAPCTDQPTTRKQLAASFQSGRFPLASQITGTWVEIGEISDFPSSSPFRNLNCSGLTRGNNFEFVLVADGYSVDLHAVSGYPDKVTMQPDGKGAVTFPVDFAADEGPDIYRCRLTKRGTLACLIRGYDGAEFRKMKVDKAQIYEGSDIPE